MAGSWKNTGSWCIMVRVRSGQLYSENLALLQDLIIYPPARLLAKLAIAIEGMLRIITFGYL
jgi:hypothetical protein